MSVTIRLSRVGTKHVPFFRIVVVDSRKKRDGAYIENLGTYDARKTALVQFKKDRFDEWVQKGAQPSDTVKKIYRLFKRLETAGPVAPVAKPAAQKKTVKTESKAAEATENASQE